MIVGKAGQLERTRGTAFLDTMEEVNERARSTEVRESVANGLRVRAGHAEMIGQRDAMEDVSLIIEDFPEPEAMMFCLFDGHGGREAAEFAAKNLPKAIGDWLKKTRRVEEAYAAAFRQLQLDMKPWCVYVGTTVLTAVVSGSTLTVANAGDTRCVLCRGGKAVRISLDHKPTLPEEIAFIESQGGFVKDERVNGILAVSRALGDAVIGDAINPTPHVRQVQLTPDDTFMILACDGVWDVMTDQMAVDLISSDIDPLVAARKVRDAAFENYSTDNISAIVVFFAEGVPGDQEEDD